MMQDTIRKKLVLADFDDTIICTDSLVAIMKKEKWHVDPRMIVAGVQIVAAKFAKKNVLKYRSRFKYLMIQKFENMSEDKVLVYVKYLQSKINGDVIDRINEIKPNLFVVCSASSGRLINLVLQDVLRPDIIIANDIDEDTAIDTFSTCYGANKVDRFAEKVPDYRDYDIYVFTDSISDRPILELADSDNRYKVENGMVKPFVI